ncbi:hypothetical protein ABPG75_010368 [Micractinium tetrahymenae]
MSPPLPRLRPVGAPPSSTRLAQGGAAALPEERGGAGAGAGSGPAAPTTQIAPASDLQTRQLRLLPWQTGAAAAPGDGYTSSDETAAQRASCAAASTSGRDGAVQLQRRARRAAPGNVAEAGSSALASGGSADLPAGGPMRPPLPQWRQRPDYRPGALLTLQDVDLAALDGGSSSSDEAPSPGARAATAGTSSDSDAEPASPEGGTGSGGSASGGTVKRRRNFGRKAGPMSEERKAAISRALQSKGAKSEEHKRSIARAMREAHARNPRLRHSAAGQKKKCGHCGQEGHNRRACPQLLAAAQALGESLRAADQAATASKAAQAAAEAVPAGEAAAEAVPQAAQPPAPSRVIVIEEVDASPVPPEAAAAATAGAGAAVPADAPAGQHASATDGVATSSPTSSAERGAAVGSSSEGAARALTGLGGAASPALPSRSLPTLPMVPGMSLCPEGSWVISLPQSKEECVAQAAQASLRAWDDGIRRQAIELLLPQAHSSEDDGWPGGIRQQFRVAKPMVESLLLRLKEHSGLEGRITAELLDEGDCVGAWQSERLAAVLFPTADTLPDLRRIDDALSGERLTLVINPQWQTQGQVISDFGIGRARKAAERFVAAFEEVYYLRRVRVFGDDVRIMRCYPGQWQVHFVPASPREERVLLSCEDRKPTFQRLIELLKEVQGSRNSKSWLDRVLTSSMGTFTEPAAYSEQGLGTDSAAPGLDGTGGPAADAGAAPAAAGAAAPAGPPQAEAGPPLLRDIVTGEVLSSDDDEASAAARSWGSPTPPRDVRLEPVNQVASWLGAGSAAARLQVEPQPRRRSRRSGSSADGGKAEGGPSASI